MAKSKTKTTPKKKRSMFPPLGDQMAHLQSITLERELSQKELAECGTSLANEELQLEQVRKEKKEAVRVFDTTIKDHFNNIMKFSYAIQSGILTDNIESDVVLDRENGTKVCYPRSGAEPFKMEMTNDDYDFLS